MPNGKPGDNPFTDIVIHGRSVYSKTADDLIRRIARIAGQQERNRLAQRLFLDYNEFYDPDVPALERYLKELYETLLADAKKGAGK
jgi:hypothetical protein